MTDEKYYTLKEASAMIGRSDNVIRSWYRAAKYAIEIGHHFPIPLPPVYSLDSRGKWGFTADGIKRLAVARDSIRPGDLSFYHKVHTWKNKEEMKAAEDRRRVKEKFPDLVETLKEWSETIDKIK